MLGADVVVAEAEGLAQRQLKDLLGTRRERNLTGGDLFAGADDADYLSADALGRDVEALQNPCREPLLFTQQAEQDVLGADVIVLEGACLFLGEDDYLAGPLCKSLKHQLRVLPKRVVW
uniref:Unannotated protein n=1 Tax=freshwater metagenome TaxID=449393 RepID=A0A6J5ZT99_9ZZZZ